VHGEANEMGRLKAALMREYEDDPETSINIHNPKNTESVQLYFKWVYICNALLCGHIDAYTVNLYFLYYLALSNRMRFWLRLMQLGVCDKFYQKETVEKILDCFSS